MITPLVIEKYYYGYIFRNPIFIFDPPEYRLSYRNDAYQKISPLLENRIDNMIKKSPMTGIYKYFIKYTPVFILNIFRIKVALSQSVDIKYTKHEMMSHVHMRRYIIDIINDRLDIMIYTVKIK
jgi:hypothetical protein